MVESTTTEGTPQTVSPVEGTPSPAPRRRRHKGILFLLIVGLTVWGLPWIVGSTGLKEAVTYQVMPWLPPGAKFEAPSLGWLTPVNLTNVRILDHSGQVLLECDHVTSQKSLWEMATSPFSPGRWDLEAPKLYIRIEPSGTNLDSILKQALQGSGGPLLELSVSASGGRIEVRDDAAQPRAVVEDIEFLYSNDSSAGTLRGHGEVAKPDDAGDLAFQGHWTRPKAATELPTFELNAAMNQWPLEILSPWLSGNSSIRDLSGRFTATLQSRVAPTPEGDSDVIGELRINPGRVQYVRAGSKELITNEPGEIVAAVEGRWSARDDRIEFHRLECQSPLLNLSGAGKIDEARGACVIDLKGRADRDLSEWLDWLAPNARSQVTLTGLKLQEWAIQGAVHRTRADSPPLAVLVNVTWDRAELFGVNAEPGSISGGWNGEQIQFATHDVKVSGGLLVSLPRIVLAAPKTIVADSGPVLVNVAFTEPQCRGWLRFLSPLMADATSAEGTFTLAVDAGTMELGDLHSADVTGELRIQSGRIGPGRPLARQAIELAGSIAQMLTQKSPEWAEREIWLDLPAQEAPYRIQHGRVFHQQLQIQVGELLLTSHGSVGFDESLDLSLDIPLPDKWLSRSPLLASLKGEVVSIRVGGTLDRPAVDRRALAEFGKRVSTKAAGGLLQNLLERQLDKAAEKDKKKPPKATAP